jgi:hypothetical protein
MTNFIHNKSNIAHQILSGILLLIFFLSIITFATKVSANDGIKIHPRFFINAIQYSGNCEVLSIPAEKMMQHRQDGVSLEDALKAYPLEENHVHKLIKEILLEAYTQPRETTGAGRAQRVANFTTSIQVACIRALK